MLAREARARVREGSPLGGIGLGSGFGSGLGVGSGDETVVAGEVGGLRILAETGVEDFGIVLGVRVWGAGGGVREAGGAAAVDQDVGEVAAGEELGGLEDRCEERRGWNVPSCSICTWWRRCAGEDSIGYVK